MRLPRDSAPVAQPRRRLAPARPAAPGRTARAGAAVAPTAAVKPAAGGAPEPPKRGYVVLVEPTRIVIDLTAVDGLRAGTLVSLRRDRIPLVHPVTGEVLGELDDEVGDRARHRDAREVLAWPRSRRPRPAPRCRCSDRVVPK